jgi:hypothetical protein
MMKIADLSPEIIAKIKALNYDRIYEKHEGPGHWKSEFEYGEVEFINISGYDVLLPIDKEYHQNITILRVIPSADGNTLTIFFQDTSFSNRDFDSGFLAICEKMPDENFFVATVYHEWFIIENPLFKRD